MGLSNSLRLCGLEVVRRMVISSSSLMVRSMTGVGSEDRELVEGPVVARFAAFERCRDKER
jgi:hypothetical protein